MNVVASDGRIISDPINGGAANPLCATAEQKAQASPENQRSVGVLITYGRFTFLDLGDFNWAKEVELSCPVNLVGEVTVYQTSRHAAFDDAGSPTQLYAIKPQVVVVNNGPRKGLGGTSPGFDEVMTRHYQRIAGSPGLEGVWQGHRSLLAPGSEDNTAEEMIANLEETADCEGHWMRGLGRPGRHLHHAEQPESPQPFLHGALRCTNPSELMSLELGTTLAYSVTAKIGETVMDCLRVVH